MTNTVVLYHRGCADGMVAARVAHSFFGENPITYLPYQYGEKLPDVIDGAHLIMVDLSLPEETVRESRSRVKSLLIIDHHDSAKDLPKFMTDCPTVEKYLRLRDSGSLDQFILFDKNYSGAMLTWFFFTNQKDREEAFARAPYFLKLTHDYDLWRHLDVNSKPYQAYLLNSGQTFRSFLAGRTPEELEPALAIGRTIIGYDDSIVRSVKKSYKLSAWVGRYPAILINGPSHLRNELADQLLSENQIPVVACFTIRDQSTVVSLRSKDTKINHYAELFGGSGHEHSAAYSIKHGPVIKFFLSSLTRKPTFTERLKLAFDLLRGKY